MQLEPDFILHFGGWQPEQAAIVVELLHLIVHRIPHDERLVHSVVSSRIDRGVISEVSNEPEDWATGCVVKVFLCWNVIHQLDSAAVAKAFLSVVKEPT